jgi:hypothetical protein
VAVSEVQPKVEVGATRAIAELACLWNTPRFTVLQRRQRTQGDGRTNETIHKRVNTAGTRSSTGEATLKKLRRIRQLQGRVFKKERLLHHMFT